MSKAERAKQFMPFAALHGFDETIRKKETIKTVKRELSEEESERLNEIVLHLKKGDMIKAEYYSADGYAAVEGAVTEINLQYRYLRIVKKAISFDDLNDIKELK